MYIEDLVAWLVTLLLVLSLAPEELFLSAQLEQYEAKTPDVGFRNVDLLDDLLRWTKAIDVV